MSTFSAGYGGCHSNLCEHGRCVGDLCVCDDGWQGDLCNQFDDEDDDDDDELIILVVLLLVLALIVIAVVTVAVAICHRRRKAEEESSKDYQSIHSDQSGGDLTNNKAWYASYSGTGTGSNNAAFNF